MSCSWITVFYRFLLLIQTQSLYRFIIYQYANIASISENYQIRQNDWDQTFCLFIVTKNMQMYSILLTFTFIKARVLCF